MNNKDTPRLAIIGCGYWGKNLVRNVHELGALTRVCDLTETGRAKAKEIAPDVEVVDTINAALTDDIDGILIATPAETHYEIAKQALNKGKDVFVEKPMALKIAHAKELVELAKENERILMVGHVLEYHPAILQLKEMIEDGVLGKIQYLYSNRLNLGKVRREENILWSFAPHDIAVILRMMDSKPFQVICTGGAYIQPNIADITITNILFDNGVRAHIHVSWLHPFKEQRLVVVGDKKMVSFDDVNKKLVLYNQRVEMRENLPVPVRDDVGEEIPFDAAEPLKQECRAFIESIQTRTPPLTDGQSGLDVLRVLHGSQKSLITNGESILLYNL